MYTIWWLTIILYVIYFSVFDGNIAADGAAINIAFCSTKFNNVTFLNNRESAVRVSYYELIRIPLLYVIEMWLF